jgi:hypothetical protein
MISAAFGVLTPNRSHAAAFKEDIDRSIDGLLTSFPDPERLSGDERRGIIARYTAVLEGNFIYWMTGAYLAVGSEEARLIILDNLREEVRDSHPGMMRKFAIAARAVPTDSDATAVHQNLANVRQFVGRLSGVPMVVMMAFFEGFIQRFMPYLAELARRQGSAEQEYTDVHGVCDIAHTEGLVRALQSEMALTHNPLPKKNSFEGVEALRTLIENIIHPSVAEQA